VNPFVTVVDSPDFSITDGGLVRAAAANYMYGILFVEYSGQKNTPFVEAVLQYKKSNGAIVFSEKTYINNEGFAKFSSSTSITSSYVTPQYNTAVLRLIEDLSAYSVDLTDIHSIDIKFRGSSTQISEIVRNPIRRGSISKEADTTWYLPITNDHEKSIYLILTLGVLKDSVGRLGYWTSGYLQFYDGAQWKDDYQSVISSGRSGRLRFYELKPNYLTGALSMDSAVIGCSYPAGSASSISTRSLSEGPLSIDRRNYLMHRAHDEYTKALEETLR
jgi:hypothetical protein